MSTKKPLVSTISPCYKMSKYLPKFLEEYPKQTLFHDMEIVLDLNEPSLNDIQMIKAFQSKYPGRINMLITEPVIPIGTSMNKCINNANNF
jgi:hypothetical protein